MVDTGSNSTNNGQSNGQCPFYVLGIALVVDNRLVFRYPVCPTVENADDLFFRLQSLVMAKLFRPKKPLCGQPITISVGGTVFCCRAILMDDTDSEELDLFNVIVALAPTVTTAMTTASIAGWFDDTISSTTDPSDSFLTVRRVHVSLARLCRILEREEIRCHYVSEQSSLLLRIQDEVRQDMDRRTKDSSGANSVVDTSTSDNTTRNSHRRKLSSTNVISLATAITAQNSNNEPVDPATPHAQEYVQYNVEQEILELLLAQGSLAHELVQVYHALDWNEDEFVPTPSMLLSGTTHGIVYVNGHVAVAVEAAAGTRRQYPSHSFPRSYQTLLFPHASPKELLQTMSTTPHQQQQHQRRLQHLLQMVNPRKRLETISIEAALPLTEVLELAAFMQAQGACVVCSCITRSTRLACATNCISKMHEYALDFSQEFGLSIFVVVSILTSRGMALGEVMSAVAGSGRVQNQDAVMLGREMVQELQQQPSPVEIEESIYAMAVWLCSHQIVIGMEDYLVAIGVKSESPARAATPDESKESKESKETTDLLTEEALYKELLPDLQGKVSIPALCWRYGIDPLLLHRFRSWGVRNDKLRMVSRVPSPNDDWNTNSKTEG